MKNKDYPAMPLTGDAYQDFAGYKPDINDSSYNPECQGLTKREYFAAAAMQGIISSIETEGASANWIYEISVRAVEFADATLAELEN